MTSPSTVFSTPARKRPGLGASAALALLSLLAGCAGGPPGHPGDHDEPRQPPLAARAEFFAGAITAEAQVTGLRHSMAHPDGDESDRGRSGGDDRRGPPPGGEMGAGGPPPGEARGRGHRTPESAHRAGGLGSLPRQTLHIDFTNHTAAPITIVLTELNSSIGNFVPQPEKLTIAPGATAALQPVSGDAGGVLRWLDVTLALRQDSTNDRQVLRLVPTGRPAEAEAPPLPEQR